MRQSMVVAGWICCLPLCASAFGTTWDTVIFRHDFDVSADGRPDPNVWIINHPGQWWWVQGRSHFPNPDPWLPTGLFPYVENGACVIEHHSYNPYDQADPNWTFVGGEIHTVMSFEPTQPYRFEARVRCSASPNGLVTSFFLYGYDDVNKNSDEIDFEFLSNLTNSAGYPNGDPVFLNTWNESLQKPQCQCTSNDCAAPEGLDLSGWNTFRIYWDPDQRRVDWVWLDPDNAEVSLHTETDPSFIPDEAMAVYFNFWAPTDVWPCAYDAGLQAANDAAQDVVYKYEIDYVEVRVPTPEVDECPDDPIKTEPGVCGCGVPDADTDGDGTPDCIDRCPNDPARIQPGMCGCGAAQALSSGTAGLLLLGVAGNHRPRLRRRPPLLR